MKSIFFAVALISVSSPLLAQSASAPASASASTTYTVEDTDLGTLLDDPAAKAVLTKHIPGVIGNDQIGMARSMTLKQLQSYASDQVTDDVLKKIDSDLAKIPAKK